MSLVGIRRSKTVCDVRPDISSAERNGRTNKKRNVFSKILKSFSKFSKKNRTPTHQSNIEADSKQESSFELPGTSFGDVHTHNHGSDSASTGYVSEGSSRRTTDPKQCLVDLDRENKLAKRAHAQRFRPESEFIARAAHSANQRRASDTDLDRDETDLETDEDRDSEIRSEDSDECPSDSFYTSDCSSSSYVSDDDSARGASNKRFSQPIAFRQQRELRSAVRQARNDRIQSKSSKLPNIARTMSAREFNSHTTYCSFTTDSRDQFLRDIIPAPSAPSPALRARILRLEMGEQIDMEKKSEKSDDSSSVHQSPRSGKSGGNAVKKIASKFLQESSSHESDISDKPKPDNLKRTMSTNSGYKSRPVLEKFAPKLEGESKKEDEDLMKPVGIRRTQSTKILDLAANLFQPSEPIELTKKPAVERTNRTPPSRPSGGGRKLPSRSQTCKMASPTAIQRRQSSDSFIRELLEMAKVEVNLGDEKPKKINDFKSQICQASTKIARRKTFKESDNIEKPITCLRSKSTHTPTNVTISSQSANNKVEELDPFVKEILNSDTVPKAVKNKIKEECWSLFNDPRTPKGVKQCILNTMLTKTHSE